MWHFIVNPSAGNGKTGQQIPAIKSALKKAGIPYKMLLSERGWHCAELAQNAIENGARKLVAVGGDGTGHEVMNGIFNQKVVPTSEISFGFIPIGTGNDWVKTYKIPRNIEQNIAILKAEKTTFQDIGLVHYLNDKNEPTQRYFLNVAGMAYDAFVAKISNKERRKVSSTLYYYWLIFKCLFKYKTKHARLILDHKTTEQKYYTINIGLCKYSGGGMQFTPHALPDDGFFAVTGVKAMSYLGVLVATAFLYGHIGKHSKSDLSKSKSIKVEPMHDGETLLELDGEYVGKAPVEFVLLEKSLKIIVP